MASTLVVIFITAGVSVAFFLIAALLLVLVLRARDKRRQITEETARQASRGQRVRLSVGSNDYSHVPEPRSHLRTSTYLPYGVASEGWTSVSSQENLPPRQSLSGSNIFGATGTLDHNKRRRSLRASFSAHSSYLPKTRRQKKIEKAIPLGGLTCSPLSAITEQSGTNPSEASPSVGLAELPTEITPKTTPEKDGDTASIPRPRSPQWPLTSHVTNESASLNCAPTALPVPVSRKNALMGTDSTVQDKSLVQSSSMPRSISVASTFSLAPSDPLPPLPSITPGQGAPVRKSQSRISAASVDTIGSSVLEGGPATPSQTDVDLTSPGLTSSPTDLYSTTFNGHDSRNSGSEAATVRFATGSLKAKHGTDYRSGKARYACSRTSVSKHSSLQNAKSKQGAYASDHNSLIPRPCGSALTALGASRSKPGVLSGVNTTRPCVSPPISTAIAQRESCRQTETVVARHSMYEQNFRTDRLQADPAVLRDVSGNQIGPIRHPAISRPASIASENPFHWDKILQNRSPIMLKASQSQYRGHKRQNCLRISDLPAVDASRKANKLPQMTEEGEAMAESPAHTTTNIPGLSLLTRERQNHHNGASGDQHVNVPPFPTRSIWEAKLRERPESPQAERGEMIVSDEPDELDADVFRNSRFDPRAPNIFTANSTSQRQLPLPSTPAYRARPRATSPSLSAIQEPCEPDSPTLPTPVLSSATLFSRALPLGSRISAVQGPRILHASSRRSHATAPSPVAAFMAEREDLRRSAMALSKTNSETTDTRRMSRVHRSVSKSSLSDAGKYKRNPVVPASRSPEHVGTGVKKSNILRTNLEAHKNTQPLISFSPSTVSDLSSGSLRRKHSRGKVAFSPSIVSTSAASIWEDASVRGDSPESELPIASKLSPAHLDVEAHENFIGHGKNVPTDKGRDGSHMSPRRTGLGLTGVRMHGKIWGTPASLYDRDGFLQE